MRNLHFYVVTAALCSACGEPRMREELTVVVEADRTRALADQRRLAEMQASLAAASQELVDTRTDLTALRQKLLKTGALDASEMKRLEARETRLREREGTFTSSEASARPAEVAVAPGLTREDVEALLKEQEERLRTIVGSAGAPVPTGDADRDDVAARLTAIAELRSQRGLREDDVEGGPAMQRRVDDALRLKRYAVALDVAKDLMRRTEGTIVNAAFVKKKYARASGRLDTLSGEKKDRAKKLLGDANARNARGDAASANEALNAVLELR